MVAKQIARRACYRHSGCEQTHFEVPEVLLAASIRVGDQSVNEDTPGHRIFQRRLDLAPVEAENRDFYGLLRAIDSLDDRCHTVAGLYQQFHGW
jgi:hypothetical protein